jgi:hypothetical protein
VIALPKSGLFTSNTHTLTGFFSKPHFILYDLSNSVYGRLSGGDRGRHELLGTAQSGPGAAEDVLQVSVTHV